MTAALATVQRAPTPQRRPTYGDLLAERAWLLDLLAEQREWADTVMLVAVGVAMTNRPPPLSNVEAERRVLGALANGRATLRDVADLEPADLLAEGHAALFAALLTQLRSEASLGVHVRPSARRRSAETARHEAAAVRRRAVGNALVRGGDFAALAALDALPRPAACPLRDIVRVEECARARRGER